MITKAERATRLFKSELKTERSKRTHYDPVPKNTTNDAATQVPPKGELPKSKETEEFLTVVNDPDGEFHIVVKNNKNEEHVLSPDNNRLL